MFVGTKERLLIFLSMNIRPLLSKGHPNGKEILFDLLYCIVKK